MENLKSKYVSDYSNKNINRYTYNGEKPNQDYYFLSEQEFVQKINNDI